MTLLELYDQFCKHYQEGNNAALIALLRDNAALLSTDHIVSDTKEVYDSVEIAKRPKISYIAAKKSLYITTTDPVTVIEDKDNLFLKLLAFKAILSLDIHFLNETRLDLLFSAKDDQIISELLSVDEIKTLLPWAIVDGLSIVLHALLKQLLLKTNGVFNLEEPLADGLTPLEILSKCKHDANTIFTKKMMLFYAAAWNYFEDEAPTVDNINNLPCFFSLAQPVDNIKFFLDLQAKAVNERNDSSVSAFTADENIFFSENGLCLGLSYFRNWLHSRGQHEYYLMTIALLNIWKGSDEKWEKQLSKQLPLLWPQALFYNTLRELFNHWISHIIIFHDLAVNTVIKPESQSYFSKIGRQQAGMQASYFRLIRPEAQMNTRLVFIANLAALNIIMPLTQDQFDEYLKFFIKMPNAYIDVNKNNHTTSISRSLDGHRQIDHFNSSSLAIPEGLVSIDDLKKSIETAHPKDKTESQYLSVYRYDGPGHKKPWEQGSIFSEEGLPQTAVAAEAFQKNSPNGFTHLHVAVLVQDTKTINEILIQGMVATLATDRHGRCAIEIAIENAYWEGTELLLADPHIQFYTLTFSMMNMLIIYEHEDFVLRLLQHEKVRCEVYNKFTSVLECSMLYNGIKIIQDVKDLFLQDPNKQIFFLPKIVEMLFSRNEEESAKELFVWMTQHINKETLNVLLNKVLEYRDSPEKRTLLHTAIMTRNYAYAAFLLEKGADLNVPIEGGDNNGKTARQLLAERDKLTLIPEDKRKLDEKLQIGAVKAYLFFTKEMDKRLQERISGFLNNSATLQP